VPRRLYQEKKVNPLDGVRRRLEPLQSALLDHPLYRRLERLDDLHVFMEHHVFAVWDFMSLLKELQRRLCCVAVPWLPAEDSAATRFLNEVVLAEESDEDGEGGFLSHFALYHRAMQRCGARTSSIDHFCERLRRGVSLNAALDAAGVPECVQRFVRQTFDTIAGGDLCAIVSAFTFGREDLLPGLFQRIVDELNVECEGRLDVFKYYLHRHIGLDGQEHGPMASRFIASLCGDDEGKWGTVERSAVSALQARRDLWDGVCAELRRKEG
jgi:hypothetical protein